MNNKWIVVVGGALSLALSLSAAALESPHQRLTDLARELTDTSAHRHPMQATALGMTGMDGELETPNEAARTAEIAQIQTWRQKLHAIASGFGASTSLTDRDDAKLLAAQLTAQLNALLVYKVDRKDYAAPANNVVQAIFVQFQYLPVAGKEGATAQDVAGAWRNESVRDEATQRRRLRNEVEQSRQLPMRLAHAAVVPTILRHYDTNAR